MAYKVKRNNATGAFECHFEHNGHKYFARVRYVPLSWDTECSIYPEDVLDLIWGRWYVPVQSRKEFMARHQVRCARKHMAE